MVVVLPRSWESYTSDEHKLLNKILTSVKVDINAVQIIVQPALDLSALHIYSPARVLIFGAQTTEEIRLYESTAAQGFIVIRADDLSLLDDQKKKNLWVALRQMFGL
jgi:hypothetical protein